MGFENPSADGGIDELRGLHPTLFSRSASRAQSSANSSADESRIAGSSKFSDENLLAVRSVGSGAAGWNFPR